jgi:hypothetical protein
VLDNQTLPTVDVAETLVDFGWLQARSDHFRWNPSTSLPTSADTLAVVKYLYFWSIDYDISPSLLV